jgi:glutathione S-transferase
MSGLTLVIGTRNYSSWSLRPWLLMRHLGIEFTEQVMHFDTDDFRREVPGLSPTGRVPVLLHGDLRVWESIAICEYASELAGGRGWPEDRAARAHARATAAEMHAGFAAMRSQCPMNVRARGRRVESTPELERDLRRIDLLWGGCRAAFGAGGAWLYGRYSVADAMYAPVALRLATYGLEVGAAATSYVATVLDDPLLAPWLEAARTENVVIPHEEVGLTA